MKRENYRDSLEEVFSERFNESPDANEAWSLPSEAAWDAIDEQLPPERKKRRPLWWLWLGLGLILVLVLAISLSGREQHNQISADVSDTISKIEEATVVEETSTAIQEVSPIETKPTTTDNRVTKNTTTSLSSTVRTVPEIQGLLAEAKLTTPTERAVPTNIPNVENIQKITEIREFIPAVTPLSHDMLLPLAYAQAQSLPLPLFSSTEEKEIVSSQVKMQVESVLGAFWGTNKYALQATDLQLNVEAANTQKYGLRLERVLHKNWLVGTGLLYSRVQFDSDYAFDVAYQSDEEQLVAQGYASSYSRNLPSLASQFQTELVLVRDVANDIAPTTPIPVALRLAHGITYLSVPAYLQYQQRKGRWTYYLKSGVSADLRLQDLSTEHLHTTSKHNAFQHHNSEIATQNSIEGRSVTLNYLGAIGVQRHFHSRLYLYAEPSVSISLLSTYPRITGQKRGLALGGQMGLGYSF